MTSGSRRIRVTCKVCDYDKIRTLRAGDERTLDQLRQSARCGQCRAWAAKGFVSIEPADELGRPAARPKRVRDPDRLLIDSVKLFGEPTIYGRSNLTHIAPAHPRPMPRIDSFNLGPNLTRDWGFLSIARTILLYAATGLLSATLIIEFFRAAEFEQRSARLGNFNCEAKLHYMEVNGPESPYARERAYDQLAANCVGRYHLIADLRYRDRNALLRNN